VKRSTPRRVTVVGVAGLTTLAMAACGGDSSSEGGSSGAVEEGGVTTLELWTHNGGNELELGVVETIVSDFNASQEDYKVEIQSFPQDSYNDAVTAAASAEKLPCILDVDGPIMPSWAWGGYLAPLDLPEELFTDQLETTIGRVNDELYSFGHYDVALNLIARKSALEDNGIRIPDMDQPWTQEEFDDALAKITDAGAYDYALDLGTAGTGEWIPYAYSPILQSFGGDLINRDDYLSAEGVLNGPEALEFAEWFTGVIENGYAAKTSGEDSTADFVNGKTAIMYSGSWAADAVAEKFGDDVVFLPPPDFGDGPKIGGASWQWGMSGDCAAPEGALAYLEHSADPKYFTLFAETLGLIPATPAAAEAVENFAPDGKYRIFFDMSEAYAVLRPITPAYPFISSTFQKAMQDIIAGGDPQETLDKAVSDIDGDIKANGNYEF
jgi:multiple sugar transport system substrate-binding protein